MRSFLHLSAGWSRRGLTAVGAAMLALTTACDFIVGVPHVDRVEVATIPKDSMPAQTQGQAVATVYGNNDKILTSNSKISVGYASSNTAVATINPSTGLITAVGEGTTTISATARDKRGEMTLKVTPEPVRSVKVDPPTMFLNGGRTQLVITPQGSQGTALGKRPVTVNSSNKNIVDVQTDGTTTGVYLVPVTVGTAIISGDVQGVTFSLSVTVQAPQVTRITAGLQKTDNTIVVGEQSQTVVQLFGANNTPVSTAGQTITYTSSNQTVATVNGVSGVVTGQTAGTAVITATVAGLSTPAQFQVTVVERPARQVIIGNRSPFIRLGSNGTGVPSQRTAVAVDSALNQIANKVIAYRSTDPTVFTVTSLGTVTGQKLGTALLIASTDNATIADTISLTVTPMPIVQVRVDPGTVVINAGQTQQFTATLTDSVGIVVTGRAVTWTSSNPVAIPVSSTGLVTGASNAGGTATITATVDIIPGQGRLSGSASVIVTPTPIATIDVQPTAVSINLRTSSVTAVSVVPRDAAGNALVGRAGSIVATVENPAIASADGAGNIRAFAPGTTKITYQAYDSNQQPQGAPASIQVTVTSQ